VRQRRFGVPAGLLDEPLQHQDLDDAAGPLRRFGRLQKALQELSCVVERPFRTLCPVPRQ
jgi:hypothetical protein